MALTISPGVFLLTTLIGRINYHYNVRQSDTHVTLISGDTLSGEGFILTSDKCQYRIDISIESGTDGVMVIAYWHNDEVLSVDKFGNISGDERRDMFEELRKVLEGELVF